MSLTATSTIVGASIVTAWVLAATIMLWRRWPRRGRLPLRTASLLLSQVLVLVCAGLIVNRSEELYPTLQTLIDPPRASRSLPEVASGGNLDAWLQVRSQQGSQTGLAFTWRPANGSHWPLAEPPTISVPPQYFAQTSSRFPVIVAIADPASNAWADVREAGRHADPAIVVFAQPAAPGAATVTLLGTEFPHALSHDLRVLPDRWSSVGVGKYAGVALELVSAHPERYRAAAAVRPPAPRELAPAATTLTSAGKPVAFTPHIPPAAGPAESLSSSLRWASAQLPPALEPARSSGHVQHFATTSPLGRN